MLFLVSGYAATERGSELIEPRDLIKAIYSADLEHVSAFWDDWQGFERLVSSEKLANGATSSYINRTLYLVRLELMLRDSPGGNFMGLGHPSESFLQLVSSARSFAVQRAGTEISPSSIDLLFAACSVDGDLSAALQHSGLRLEQLAAAVRDGT